MEYDLLGRFFHCSVGVECQKLLLNTLQRVGKLAVIQDLDGLPDPLEEVGGDLVVFGDELVVVDGAADDLADTLTGHGLGLHLGEVMVVGDHIGDDGLLVRMVHNNICMTPEEKNIWS